MTVDVLRKSADEIRERLSELEPLVAEHQRLKEALQIIERFVGQNGSAARSPARIGKPAPATSVRRSEVRAEASVAKRDARSSGRRRATRAQRFVDLVEKYPGITVPDAAKRMRTTPNSLYQVTSTL